MNCTFSPCIKVSTYLFENILACLLGAGAENLTLTRRDWNPQSYTMTYFDEGRIVVYIQFFSTYEEIKTRIMKGV